MTHAAGAPADIVERACRIPVAEDGELDAVVTLPGSGAASWAVLVHGGPQGAKDGPAGLYRMLAARLAGAGIASVRYDARGSGSSSGTFRDTTLTSLADDLHTVRAWLHEHHHPDRVALVGESLGGTVAAAGLEGTEAALVLLYAATRLRDAVPDWLSADALVEAQSVGFIVREASEISWAFLREIQQRPDVLGALNGLATPTLLIHGDQDVEVDLAQSQEVARVVAGPARLVVVPGGGHGLERPAEQEIVCRETVAWLTRHR